MAVPTLPSQLTLLISPIVYTAGFHFLTSSISTHKTSTRLAQSREILSVVHCTLITILTLSTLRQHSSSIYPTPETLAHLNQDRGSTFKILLPIISTKSSACNCLMAFETGYLLADTIILLRISKTYHESSSRTSGSSTVNGEFPQRSTMSEKGRLTTVQQDDTEPNSEPKASGLSTSISTSIVPTDLDHHHHHHHQSSKNSQTGSLNPTSDHQLPISPSSTSKPNRQPSSAQNPPGGLKPLLKPTPLLLHHLTLLPPLLLLQSYITLHLDRGIIILTSFLLMNASSPLSSLRWWLLHLSTWKRRQMLLEGVGWLYWGVYAVCRLYLIWWVLMVYALQRREMLCGGEAGRQVGRLGEGLEDQLGRNGLLLIWWAFWGKEGGLRWWCRVGMGGLWGINVWWCGWGVWGMISRKLKGGEWGDKVSRVSRREFKGPKERSG